MRVLTNDDVEALLTPQDVLESLEAAYVEYAAGRAANRPRTHTYFPVEDADHPGFRFRFKSQEGGNVSSGVWALRITSDMVGVEALGGGIKRRRLMPVAPGGRYVGLVTLYSLKTLEPLAILHDSVVQKMRVAATSALGIRELASERRDGRGHVRLRLAGRAHLECLLHGAAGDRGGAGLQPDAGHREKFAATWSERTGRRIVAADDPRGAVEGCRIVTCATAAMDPCFDGAWLEPGTTSRRSPRPTAPRCAASSTTPPSTAPTASSCSRASRCTTTSRSTSSAPSTRGRIELGRHPRARRPARPAAAPARTGDDEITIFANNTGMGLQFAAVGARLLATPRSGTSATRCRPTGSSRRRRP